MKKFILILLLLIPIGLLVSCSDDVSDPTSVADCQVTLTFNNVAVINGVIYATQDYPLEVESVNIYSPSGSTKGISEVEYSVDNHASSIAKYAPFTGRFDTRYLTAGVHPLGVLVDLIQTDNSQIPDNMQYNFTVVPTVEDLPAGAELGTFTQTFKVG
ncbi:MAG: hypothetical protein K2K81_11150 [Muribaculaceae bacterium]|nr:hypothetical protein [Muribaculaceae bacterium]